MKQIHIFEFEFPYWKNKRMEITLHKLVGDKHYVYRLAIWKYKKLGKEFGGHANEWGTNWWKFYDIWKGEIR